MEMDISVGEGGDLLHTDMLLCSGMCKKVIVRTDKVSEAQDSRWTQTVCVTYCRNGTNDHEQPRSVPFGSTRSNRVKTRPHQAYSQFLTILKRFPE